MPPILKQLRFSAIRRGGILLIVNCQINTHISYNYFVRVVFYIIGPRTPELSFMQRVNERLHCRFFGGIIARILAKLRQSVRLSLQSIEDSATDFFRKIIRQQRFHLFDHRSRLFFQLRHHANDAFTRIIHALSH